MKVLEKLKRILASATIGLLVMGFLPTGALANQELPQIVINEIKTAGITATDEFVELYNPTETAVQLQNLKLSYKASDGNSWTTRVSFNSNNSIPAKGYLLIGGTGYSGTVSPDISNSLGLSATGGHLAIKSGGTDIDKVGWVVAEDPEVQAAPAPAAGQSIERTNGVDTGNNAADFTVRNLPTPTNSLSVTVDTTAPTLAEVTPIPTPTNDTTPSYAFSSSEAGTVSYVGSCGTGNLANAVSGSNTITFTVTSDGAYSDCVIKVKDAQNNESALNITSFTVDTNAPDKTADLFPNHYVNDTTFSNFRWDPVTDENGPVEYRLQYSLSQENNELVTPTVTDWTTLDQAPKVIFTEGAVVWWQVQTRDKAGNTLGWSDIVWFTIDNTAPTLADFSDIRTNEIVTVQAEADDNLTPNDISYHWHSNNPAVQIGTPAGSSTTISASSDGVYQVTLDVADYAQNMVSKTFIFEWDTFVSPITKLVAMGGENEVDLLWDNPTDTDLASILIYRSLIEGELGSLQATLVGGQTAFTDNNVLPGVTYYYTVVAVDALGNESLGEKITVPTKIIGEPTDEQEGAVTVTAPLARTAAPRLTDVSGSIREADTKKEVKAAVKEEIKAENKEEENASLPAWGIALLALVGLLGLYLLWNQYPEMFGWLLFWKRKKENNSKKLK